MNSNYFSRNSELELSNISDGLYPSQEGIWVSEAQRKVSFPTSQYKEKFEVEDRSFWFKQRNRCIVEAIRNFPPNGAFFDIGGGNGYVSLAIEKVGIETFLIEPGLEGVRNAQSRGLQNTINTTFEDARFKADRLPAVGLFDVLEHIEDDALFLKEVRRTLAKNGRFYLTVPANPFLWSAMDEFAGHHRRYSSSELNRKLLAAGFEVEYLTHIFSYLVIPIFLLRTILSALKLRRSEKVQNATNEDEMGLTVENFIKPIMRYELLKIKHQCRIPWGTSCLCVAKKI